MKNKTLNILKAVSAILIVFNHCTFPGILGDLFKGYGRISVPIFFMISGYYVFNNGDEKIKKKIKHIFHYYFIVVWPGLYLILLDIFYLINKHLYYT